MICTFSPKYIENLIEYVGLTLINYKLLYFYKNIVKVVMGLQEYVNISDQDKINIENNISFFKSQPYFHKYCSSSIVNMNSYFETKSTLKEISAANYVFTSLLDDYVKHIMKPVTIQYEEIHNLLEKFLHEYEEKKLEAIQKNKKLLIVLAEVHKSHTSTMFEALISTILKYKDINSILMEADEEMINSFHNDYSEDFQLHFFKEILSLEFKIADPLRAKCKNNPLNIERIEGINTAIANYSDKDQLAIMGERHLKHIVYSVIINDKFVILPIYVDNPVKSEIAKSFYDMARSMFKLPKIYNKELLGVVNLGEVIDFDHFTQEQLLEIYSIFIADLHSHNVSLNTKFTSQVELLDRCDLLNGYTLEDINNLIEQEFKALEKEIIKDEL